MHEIHILPAARVLRVLHQRCKLKLRASRCTTGWVKKIWSPTAKLGFWIKKMDALKLHARPSLCTHPEVNRSRKGQSNAVLRFVVILD